MAGVFRAEHDLPSGDLFVDAFICLSLFVFEVLDEMFWFFKGQAKR